MQPHGFNTTRPNGMEPHAVLSQSSSEPDPGFGGSAGISLDLCIIGAGWDMTSGPIFPDFDDQFANAGNAFVFPSGNLLGDEPMLASLSASHVAAPIAGPAAPPTAPTLPRQPPQHRFPCTQAPCVETFTRDADRVRHERSTHFAQHGAHRCPIAGCPKSYGAGYSRPDKVTEHLRKKHGAQGKAVTSMQN